LVLAAVDDEWEAERVVALLRDEGELAVTRPDGGHRLEGWRRHTRPMTFGLRLMSWRWASRRPPSRRPDATPRSTAWHGEWRRRWWVGSRRRCARPSQLL